MNPLLKDNLSFILSGIVSAALVGSSAYFCFSAYNKEAASFEDLLKTKTELSALKTANPSPSEENLAVLQRQTEETKAALEKLTQDVKALHVPLPQMAPADFPKALNEKAQHIAKFAEESKVQIPPNFYLHFDKYVKTVPKADFAPALGRQLQAAGLLLETLIQSTPSELKTFERTEIEVDPAPAPPAKDPTADKGKEKSKDKDKAKNPPPAKPLLTGNTFKLEFITKPSGLRHFLNALASQKEYLLVTRSLSIQNEKLKGPPKKPLDTDAPPSAASPAALGAAPPATSAPDAGQFILGDEKITVSMRVELVTFND
ncbi:MAG: hypothetical protein RLZZ244_2952 [Verrucomicrobiota bacterium]|jgi:hypothetical protein